MEAEFSLKCTRCGPVDLTADQIWLVLSEPPARSRYAFRCPGCSSVEQRPADDDTVALLSVLVAVEELDIPPEALEPRRGQTLTTDDLIDMMLSITAFETASGSPTTLHR
jgi:hypothetical protein